MPKKFASYKEFATELLISAMADDYVAVVCNYEDYWGLISTLCENTINGKSLYFNRECFAIIDDDIATAQMNDGNMLITICGDGEIIGEPIVFKNPEAFDSMTYYIEYDAKTALEYPICGNKVLFQIIRA